MSEKCQRCGERGEDRRTLWMACLYEMNELGLPLKQCRIRGEYLRKTGKRKSFTGDVPVFKKPSGEDRDRENFNFYTLSVCKSCRADWMNAIKNWFNKGVREIDEAASVGSGIFVRRNGATIEITDEEWVRDNPHRMPVRVKRENEI